ncbi:MAG: ABC transporter ATP-binding protein [Arthrobacter sp.]|jgi:ABC-type glutathione transport system ATPase component|nr:ABC transporter ATP-binding protein [Arthrobacter sp.]
MSHKGDEVLSVRGLRVSYAGAPALRGIDLSLRRGEILAVVGESGSGKSTLTRALLGLLPASAHSDGSIVLAGIEVTARTAPGLRGGTVSLVPQDPGASLDPVRSIGSQLRETLRLGPGARRASRAELGARAAELLASVGIDRPEERLRQYPHELSGGQKQRVLIALAFSRHPEVLVADEPTSALDVTVQRTVLETFTRVAREQGSAVVFITHDIAVATDLADRVLVLRHGEVIETDTVPRLAAGAASEYTRTLLAEVLFAGAGVGSGCKDDAASTGTGHAPAEPPALRLSGVSKRFGHGAAARTVLHDVDLTLPRGRTLALVGESGSGKSTTARIAMLLSAPDVGTVEIHGRDVTGASGALRRETWRSLQLVHQNPDRSLDPRWSVERIVAEPLRYGAATGAPERAAAVGRALESVKLADRLRHALPGELSGGQRQRVAIARALAVGATTLVLDEALSALDVVTQNHVLDLLAELQAEHRLSYLFISHDLAVVERFSDATAVLAGGRVVEAGPTARLFADPRADATRALLDARPGTRLRELVA